MEFQTNKRFHVAEATRMHAQQQQSLPSAPAYTNFPHNPAMFDERRVISNPEQAKQHERQGEIRQVNPPIGRFNDVQHRVPQPRYGPSTELLETIHPGSTKRANWHSDPALNSDNLYRHEPPFRGSEVAIPSRGLPGPFNYGYPPPVSLEHRRRNIYSDYSKGRKNPSKRLSDDARRAGLGSDIRRQPSNPGWPNRVEAFPQVQSPHMYPSALPVPHTAPLSANVASSYRYPSMSHKHSTYGQLSNMQDVGPSGYTNHTIQPSGTASHDGQVSRYVSNPFAEHSEQTTTQDSLLLPPESRALASPYQQQTQQIQDSMTGLMSHENSFPNATGALPTSTQIMDLNASGDKIPQVQTPTKIPGSVASKKQGLGTYPSSGAEVLHKKQSNRSIKGGPSFQQQDKEPEIGCIVWVGNIPIHMNRTTIHRMLSQCAGFLNVSEPRTKLRTHAFAYVT